MTNSYLQETEYEHEHWGDNTAQDPSRHNYLGMISQPSHPILNTSYIISVKPAILTRQVLSKDRDENTMLLREYPYKVLCSCTLYGGSGIKYPDSHYAEMFPESLREQHRAEWEKSIPAHLLVPCSFLILRRGEEIYKVRIWLNRRMMVSQTQMWRTACWKKLLPMFQEVSKQQELRRLVPNSDSIPEVKRGRPKKPLPAPKLPNERLVRLKTLTANQAARRIQLVRQWAPCQRRCDEIIKQIVTAAQDGNTTRLVKLNWQLGTATARLQRIYDEAASLAPVPVSWTAPYTTTVS